MYIYIYIYIYITVGNIGDIGGPWHPHFYVYQKEKETKEKIERVSKQRIL